ncbi:unnamed protein product [Trichogramma brassicae]|uniref:Tc1-like transposase DDE domain-containing protein n=1 Tax=Trichogramma brassicae TaxID=86971 RepID=A0A6H5I310_9HYME|nr:unnamed protein product [Trichogramma brassicae]
MTWIGIIGEEFIGPYFFEVNITGRLYAGFLRRIALPRLREVNPDAWWQQDGSPVHGSRKSRANLNSLFPNRWIGRGGPIPWPAKSPDLTVCDYGLWADLKRRVHKRGPPANVEELTRFIEKECRQYPRESIRRATSSMKRRMTLCLRENGGHYQQFLKTRRERDKN